MGDASGRKAGRTRSVKEIIQGHDMNPTLNCDECGKVMAEIKVHGAIYCHQCVVSSDREQLIRLARRVAYVLAHDFRTNTVGTREVALGDLRLEYNNTVAHLKEIPK